MDFHVNCEDVVARLRENELEYQQMPISEKMNAIVLTRGARLLGPFDQKTGESILWLNEAWKSKERFRKLLKEEGYDVGGERLWIAPEFTFFTKEKKRFDETYTVQKAMDPGDYRRKDRKDGGAAFEMKTLCNAYEMPFPEKWFAVEKTFDPVSDPLFYLDDYRSLSEGVAYGGYTQTVRLTDLSSGNRMQLEPWFLTQVNPGGEVLIPYFGQFEFEDYYEPITQEYQVVEDGWVRLKITGDRKFKTAYKSAITFGRAGYFNQLGDGRYYILVRNYHNDPSAPYCSEPYKALGKRGCSLYVYNDSGENGGFAEFENSGLPIGFPDGKNEGTSCVTEWFYIGEERKLAEIAKRLLGIPWIGNKEGETR